MGPFERDRGTPQGSAVSPVLANLFMHYAFDQFLAREFPTVDFERYADDAVVHCATERQAREVLGGAGGADGGGRVAAAPGQDQDRVLQGRPGGVARLSTRRSRSLGIRSRPRKARYPDGEALPRSCPRSARRRSKR